MNGVPTLWLAGAALGVGIAALVVVVVRRRRHWHSALLRELAGISYDQHAGIVLPKADEGFIHIDLVLLVRDGVLVVDTKDVSGIVFGGDRMEQWTVIDGQRRYTFANPQAGLYDRVAAVRQVLRGVPVAGKLLFPREARFEKGVPGDVITIDELLASYQPVDRRSPPPAVLAFRKEWEALASASARA